jgi:hypothetical protein
MVHCYVHTSRHWFLSWATWIGSTSSHPVVLRYIIILYSYIYLVILKVISLSSLLNKTYVFLMRATCYVYLILNLITITIFGEEIIESKLSMIWGFDGGDYEECFFWNVSLCRSCMNRRFAGKYLLRLQGRKIRERGTSVSRCLETEILSSETSVHTRFIGRQIPEDSILQVIPGFLLLRTTPWRLKMEWRCSSTSPLDGGDWLASLDLRRNRPQCQVDGRLCGPQSSIHKIISMWVQQVSQKDK